MKEKFPHIYDDRLKKSEHARVNSSFKVPKFSNVPHEQIASLKCKTAALTDFC